MTVMDLKCPKCASENRQRLALAMNPLVGVIVIAGIIYGGFLCNRCGNQFVPQ